MTEIIGVQTIVANGIPTGVDGDRLAKWQMRDGRTYQQIIQMLALVIAEKNQMFASKWGWKFSIGEDLMVEYEQGGSVTRAPKITDVSDITATAGTTIGHMIDLFDYGVGVGGSSKYWRDGRMAKFMSDIRTAVRRLEWLFEFNLLNRDFVNTEFAVGAAGFNVGFVNGTVGNVDFQPPAFAGEAFATSHTHYVGLDSGSKGFADVIEEGAEHLIEHGHEAPFECLVSKVDFDAGSYSVLDDWVRLQATVVQQIDRGGQTTGNNFFASGTPQSEGIVGYYDGRYGQINVRMSPRVPTGHAKMEKSYGQLDARNSLRVRVHPDVGFGIRIIPETTNDDKWPLKQVNFTFEFEVGVGEDRTNGVSLHLVSGGTFVNPTIT